VEYNYSSEFKELLFYTAKQDGKMFLWSPLYGETGPYDAILNQGHIKVGK
jgi:hypothetical protein